MSLFSYIEKEKFTALLFDMDGVLCDSEPFIAEAAVNMFQEVYGVTVSPTDFLPFVGMGEDKFLQGVADQYSAPLRLPEDKVKTYDIYLEIIRNRLLPVPGVVRFVKEARKRGLKTAVATSADQRKMTGNLTEIGLPPDSFDACITGEDIQNKKPDPETFLTAASRLGINPERCLVFEDAVNGVQAAKAAGCGCVGVSNTFDEDVLFQAGADRVIPNFL